MTSPESHRRNGKRVQVLVESHFQVVEQKDKAVENGEVIRKLEDQSVQCQKKNKSQGTRMGEAKRRKKVHIKSFKKISWNQRILFEW